MSTLTTWSAEMPRIQKGMTSPPPVSVKHKKKSKDKEKSKHKGKSQETRVQAPQHGRNEGTNPNWAYKPPAGMVALDTTHMDEDYDWEAVKNDENKELWILRVPEGFKLKQLEGLQIEQPSDFPGARLTTLERKRAKYDVWAFDPSHTDDTAGDDAARAPRGEEIAAVSCLLPRKKKGGKLYISPKPISQHIIITHSPAAPQIDTETAPTPSVRPRVPKHLLKHRFMPYGAASSDQNVVHPSDTMGLDVEDEFGGTDDFGGKEEFIDVDKVALVSPVLEKKTPKKTTSSLPQTPASKKAKKRKNVTGEDESPKKSKKPKL